VFVSVGVSVAEGNNVGSCVGVELEVRVAMGEAAVVSVARVTSAATSVVAGRVLVDGRLVARVVEAAGGVVFVLSAAISRVDSLVVTVVGLAVRLPVLIEGLAVALDTMNAVRL
jgi:hypothetical protein